MSSTAGLPSRLDHPKSTTTPSAVRKGCAIVDPAESTNPLTLRVRVMGFNRTCSARPTMPQRASNSENTQAASAPGKRVQTNKRATTPLTASAVLTASLRLHEKAKGSIVTPHGHPPQAPEHHGGCPRMNSSLRGRRTRRRDSLSRATHTRRSTVLSRLWGRPR